MSHNRIFASFSMLLVTCVTTRADDVVSASRVIRTVQIAAGGVPPVITALAAQPAGPLLVGAGDDHLVRVWDRYTGQLVRTLEGHSDWVRAAAFTADGSYLLTAGADGRIFRWALAGKLGRQELVRWEASIACLAIHPQKPQFAAASHVGQLTIRHANNGRLIRDCDNCEQDIDAVAFSPDGAYLAAGLRDGTIRLWHYESQKLLWTIRAHRQRIRGLAFGDGGQTLISGGEDRIIRVTSLNTGESLMELRSTGGKIMSMETIGRFYLATGGSDNSVRLWDLRTAELLATLKGHTGTVVALDYDGQSIISSGYDTTVRIWPLSPEHQARAERNVPAPSGESSLSLKERESETETSAIAVPVRVSP